MTNFMPIDGPGRIVSSGRILMDPHKFHMSIARGVKLWYMRSICHPFDTPPKLVLHCEYFEANVQE